MNLDLRNRDMNKKISFKQLWLIDQFEKIRLAVPESEFSNEELKNKLLNIYEKRYISEGRLFNNTTNDNLKISQEGFINYFLNFPYILSGYSTFYKNQNDAENISSMALNSLLTSRKFFKKKQGAAEYGSDLYVYYKVMQLTFKVLANSYYGILGERNSAFYNPFVQNSITMTGQDLITTSIVALEGLLSNNVLFEDEEDLIEFFRNILHEKPELNILEYIDKPVSKEELKIYLKGKFKSEEIIDDDILDSIIKPLNEEQVSRLFYKNRILTICKNRWFVEKIQNMLKYGYAEQPEEGMKEDLEAFKKAIVDFCHYDYLVEDRYKRAVKDGRHSIVTIDTDSNFINLNKYVLEITKRFGTDPDDPVKKQTIFNIFMDIVTETLKRIFWKMTTNLGLIDEGKPIIAMKPEFVYKRLLLTKNKKSYAGLITGELGRVLDKPTLDVKGLSIKKSSVPKILRKKFTEILEKDVLRPNKINIKEILNKYDELENSILDSLKNGNVEYSLPRALQLSDAYKFPERIEGLRGALTWNAIEPEHEVALPDKVNMLKLVSITDPDDPRLNEIKEKYPRKYEAICKVVLNTEKNQKIDFSKFGFSTVSFPKSIAKIPEYLIPLIDFQSMIANNMSNGYIILESLGINCETVKNVNYKSNIIEI